MYRFSFSIRSDLPLFTYAFKLQKFCSNIIIKFGFFGSVVYLPNKQLVYYKKFFVTDAFMLTEQDDMSLEEVFFGLRCTSDNKAYFMDQSSTNFIFNEVQKPLICNERSCFFVKRAENTPFGCKFMQEKGSFFP